MACTQVSTQAFGPSLSGKSARDTSIYLFINILAG
jgi:hypothetical protein